jgi:hypothetical protein
MCAKMLFAALLGSAEAMTGVALVTAIVIGALYVGRELFVPVARAILLSFVLAPLARAPAALANASWAVRGHRRSAGIHKYFFARRSDRGAGGSTRW